MRKGLALWAASYSLAAILVAWTALGTTAPAVGGTLRSLLAANSSSGSHLAAVLEASGPHSSVAEHTQVMGRLIGTWDVQYTDFSKDGTVKHRTGQLIFGWVLDGRVVQDLWIVDPTAPGKEREVYTDLFYFDPKSGGWATAFIDPEHPSTARFTSSEVAADRIALETKDFGGKDTRWSFNNVGADSFVYRAEESSDAGKTWRLQSEYHMSRSAPRATPHVRQI